MIKEKDFEKLSQLSRIEFLLRKKKIEKETESNNTLSLLHNLVYISIFVSILVLELLILKRFEVVERLINVFNILLPFIGFILAFTIVSDLYFELKRDKLNKELEDKFFKVIIKKEKENGRRVKNKAKWNVK